MKAQQLSLGIQFDWDKVTGILRLAMLFMVPHYSTATGAVYLLTRLLPLDTMAVHTAIQTWPCLS